VEAGVVTAGDPHGSTADRLAEVRARIDRAAIAAGRDPAAVRLVAVSKTRGPDDVRAAHAAGQRAFGENYAQELATKAEALADLAGIEWHFIGHLQTNKAKVVAKYAHAAHTVDSVALARELGKRVAREGRRLPVLIEVNVANEPQKAGASASEIEEVMREVRAHDSLALRGLMTMPPADDLEAARRCFETLVSLRNLHGGAATLPELSMGMSHDFELAIACGATLVRVGTAIFGPRG
jgi:pyridoxal phosphate enzyme (YggS family)